ALAFNGRLAGVIWTIWPTQVAHFAALLLGTTAVLWLCRIITGRYALLGVTLSGWALVTTHTRTALVAAIIGLAVAATSLFLGHVRVRRISAVGIIASAGVAVVFASELMAWLMRGQTDQEALQLTGRTKVWSQV